MWTIVMEFFDKSVVVEKNVKFYEIQEAILRMRTENIEKPPVERITIK